MPRDAEIIDRIGLEEPTELELEMKEKISPADYSIYLTKLELICEEGKQNLVNTGLSPLIQAADCIVGIYTASGDLALASVGTYLHICTGFIPIKYALKYFKKDPTVGIEDGDIFFVNEVLYGGFHNMDQVNFMPVFWRERIIAWVAACSHEPETGASEPEGFVPNARTRYEEGLKVPPLKVGAKFQLKNDMMDFVANMVRQERVILTDMRARTAVCLKVRERLLEIVGEKGPAFLAGVMRKVIESVSEGARLRIRELNDGVYRHAAFFDRRGNTEGLGCIHIALKKTGDEILVDLSGTSPATRTLLNAKPHVVRGLLAGLMMQFLFADFPVTTAVIAPFKFKAPRGSILNSPDDRATGGCMRVCYPAVNGIMVCLAKMLFSDERLRERATSPPGCAVNPAHGTAVDESGRERVWHPVSVPNAAGGAATPYHDGMDAAIFWFSGLSDSRDTEHAELQLPALDLFRKLRMDQAGAGKFRGGAGISILSLFHDIKDPMRLLYQTANDRIPCDFGVMGGYSGGLTPPLEVTDVEGMKTIEQLGKDMPYSYEDICRGVVPFVATTTGKKALLSNGEGLAYGGRAAGGYGDVLERDPQLVMTDVRKGIYSVWTAKNVYHVAFDESTLEVDSTKTRELRERAREARKKKALPYLEFERNWLLKKPKDEILQLYGPWPQGMT